MPDSPQGIALGENAGVKVGINSLFLIPREVGGVEVHLRGLLSELRRAAPSLELIVFTNSENHDSFQDYSRVRIGVRAVSRPRRIWAEQFSLPRAARATGIDLLYSPGYTAPLRMRCAQVVTIYDTQFLDFPADFSWVQRQAHRVLVGGAARVADAITTISMFSADRIHENLGVPRDHIFVAPSGLSGSFAEPHACAQERPFLLYVANTYPHKNAARLVEAFARIADRIPHTLVIVGQPREGEPPAHPRVRRLYYIEQAELIGLYQNADLLVFPSLYEGFGRPVLEAMEAGTRVIAAGAGAVPEIGGDAATYFDGTRTEAIAEAIVEALAEPEDVRARYLAAGRAQAARYDWVAGAQNTLTAFTYALARHTHRKT